MDLPFRFTRESTLRVDRDGQLWHDGAPILNPNLAQGLARWIVFDPETQRYMMRNAIDWCFITVDATPLMITAVTLTPAGPRVQLSDGTAEPLVIARVRLTPEGQVYAWVHEGALLARMTRSAAFTFLDAVSLDPETDAVTLDFGGQRHTIVQIEASQPLPPTFDGVLSEPSL
ncbi:MAG: hypothetical protein JNK72_26315 [Myxococcales bacterium]|nr:hypothetical protein [Myxococcales bacterium]